MSGIANAQSNKLLSRKTEGIRRPLTKVYERGKTSRTLTRPYEERTPTSSSQPAGPRIDIPVSVKEAGERLRNRSVSVTELTKVYLIGAKQFGPKLNVLQAGADRQRDRVPFTIPSSSFLPPSSA